MTLPEMVFGESCLEISNEAIGFKYNFNAWEALKACSKEAGIKVSFERLCAPEDVISGYFSRE
jgi:hypothetical protein